MCTRFREREKKTSNADKGVGVCSKRQRISYRLFEDLKQACETGNIHKSTNLRLFTHFLTGLVRCVTKTREAAKAAETMDIEN